MIRNLLTIFFVLFIGACASTQDGIQYYYLPNSTYQPPMQEKNAMPIEVITADYLSSPAIAIGVSQSESIELTKNNLWADNLAKSIQINLANKLNKLGESQVRSFTVQPIGKKTPVLNVYIEKFQGFINGNVEVIGYAQLLDEKKNIINSISFNEKAHQNSDGYQAMVEALDKALNEVANKIFILF